MQFKQITMSQKHHIIWKANNNVQLFYDSCNLHSVKVMNKFICTKLRMNVRIHIKSPKYTLVGMTQWIECSLANQGVTASVPSQGTCLGCKPGPQ